MQQKSHLNDLGKATNLSESDGADSVGLHFLEALAAINRASFCWLKRNGCFAAACIAYCLISLALLLGLA